jgi:hypothetical protein
MESKKKEAYKDKEMRNNGRNARLRREFFGLLYVVIRRLMYSTSSTGRGAFVEIWVKSEGEREREKGERKAYKKVYTRRRE